MIEGFDYFEFEISSYLPCIDSSGEIIGNLRVAFLLSSAVMGQNYSIQKFDIEMVPDQALPGTHLALEQKRNQSFGRATVRSSITQGQLE